jgi:uncharacterized membrane protein YidH (DUF202 family)
MKEEQDYIRDIADIRSMMERSSKFLSLSGWAGIMAGIYALSGAFIAWKFLGFNPGEIGYSTAASGSLSFNMLNVILLAITVLFLATGTAVFLSYKKAGKKGEKLWNPTSKRLLINMSVPLIAGGLLILILISNGLIGLVAPFTLLFYGLALYNAGKFTYEVVKILGLTEMALGLMGSYFVGYGLLFWALGFGVVHIIYGIYIHYRYEK